LIEYCKQEEDETCGEIDRIGAGVPLTFKS
jgi:hypothetical protein